jgi:hypothetical protein
VRLFCSLFFQGSNISSVQCATTLQKKKDPLGPTATFEHFEGRLIAMASQPSQSSSFIDQLLAGQLVVAARAHDSLSKEVSNFLPSSISDIFPQPTEHSRKVCYFLLDELCSACIHCNHQ